MSNLDPCLFYVAHKIEQRNLEFPRLIRRRYDWLGWNLLSWDPDPACACYDVLFANSYPFLVWGSDGVSLFYNIEEAIDKLTLMLSRPPIPPALQLMEWWLIEKPLVPEFSFPNLWPQIPLERQFSDLAVSLLYHWEWRKSPWTSEDKRIRRGFRKLIKSTHIAFHTFGYKTGYKQYLDNWGRTGNVCEFLKSQDDGSYPRGAFAPTGTDTLKKYLKRYRKEIASPLCPPS